MFTGKYSSTINSNHQITPPGQFTAQLMMGAVVTQGFDRNLMVMPSPAFKELTERVMGMNLADPLTRNLLRTVLGNACEITLNGTGQLNIPENLGKMIDLQSQAIIVGLGDFFEVWSAEVWSVQETILKDIETDPRRYTSLNLCMR
jgi:MraZ protein